MIDIESQENEYKGLKNGYSNARGRFECYRVGIVAFSDKPMLIEDYNLRRVECFLFFILSDRNDPSEMENTSSDEYGTRHPPNSSDLHMLNFRANRENSG